MYEMMTQKVFFKLKIENTVIRAWIVLKSVKASYNGSINRTQKVQSALRMESLSG